MRIDIQKRVLKKALKSIRMLENMDFSEINGSDKQDDLYGIVTDLETLRDDVENELIDMEEYEYFDL